MDAARMEDLVQRLHESFNEFSASTGVSPGSVPYPAADAAALAAFDATHADWPPSYRTFLSLHNGWEGFELVFTLIGADGEHTKKALKDIDKTLRIFDEKWAARFGPPTPEKIAEFEAGADLSRNMELDAGVYLPHMMVFGTDFAGSLYYFVNDGRGGAHQARELRVIERDVYGEIIRVCGDFPAFLQDTLEFRRSLID
ncbi:hypothetical protein AWB75_06209 [Caballeronia catudaia]|uniref:Knr4/Smi1-like domain-containing protein n=1 Tax=Caballeronia catudaia TaxID=1777136 RepID=A0A158D5B0_9BURK|nr:hypothetical protein [Caballeronia catudaia]SAK89701.1 hypothetical protein AWB75_06209 [Caballeronia catudaia]